MLKFCEPAAEVSGKPKLLIPLMVIGDVNKITTEPVGQEFENGPRTVYRPFCGSKHAFLFKTGIQEPSGNHDSACQWVQHRLPCGSKTGMKHVPARLCRAVRVVPGHEESFQGDPFGVVMRARSVGRLLKIESCGRQPVDPQSST